MSTGPCVGPRGGGAGLMARGGRGVARAWPDLDLLTHAEHALNNRAAGDAAPQVLHLLARLVHVERADDDHLGVAREVAHGHRDVVGDVLGRHVDVVPELRRDGHDRRAVGDGALDERLDVLMLLQRRRLLHQVDLVLQDDDVLQLHDLDSGEQCGVHDSSAVKHGRHQNVVTGAVDERHVPHELIGPFALHNSVLGGAAARQEVARARAKRVLALVDLGVGVAKLDGNVTLQFVLEADSLRGTEQPVKRGPWWAAAAAPCALASQGGPSLRYTWERRTCTPEMAFTTVDLPWATWPMVPAQSEPEARREPRERIGRRQQRVSQVSVASGETIAQGGQQLTDVNGGLAADDLRRERVRALRGRCRGLVRDLSRSHGSGRLSRHLGVLGHLETESSRSVGDIALGKPRCRRMWLSQRCVSDLPRARN
eukprot:scaffold109653_cov78-Phaeocystis_antarctica.AAC.2